MREDSTFLPNDFHEWGNLFFTRRTRELLPPSEVAEETNYFLPVHHLLIMQTATGFGIIKAILPPRGFFWTQTSPVSLHIPYEELQEEINHYRPHWVLEVTEPTESCHKQGICDRSSWWRESNSHGWVKQLGLKIYHSQLFSGHY